MAPSGGRFAWPGRVDRRRSGSQDSEERAKFAAGDAYAIFHLYSELAGARVSWHGHASVTQGCSGIAAIARTQ
jgi:hypothetical protein